MAEKPDKSTKVPELRRQAEERLCTTRRDVAALSVEEAQRLVYELQVHQIELDMQNEELRRTQVDLEAARDRYVGFYDFSPAGYLILDTSGTIVESNLRAATLLGLNREKLIGQPLARFVEAEDQAIFQRHCQEVVKTGLRQTCEVLFWDKSGVSRWLYLESLAVHEEPGRIIHWRTALLDISDRKRAGQAKNLLIRDLSRSQQHFQALFNWTPSAVGISTVADGRFCDVNEGFSRLTGYTREELIGRTTLELGLWADPSERATVLRELQEQGCLHNREGLLRTKSGEIRSLMVSVESIQLGSTPCLIYLGHDITERKRVEETLRLAKFSMDRAADAVYWIDPQAKILDVNEAASLMLDYSKDELCAMTVHDLNPDFQADTWLGFWEETKRRGTMKVETAHRAKNGRLIPVEVSVNYLAYEGKEYHCAFVRDITARKRAEEELRRSEAFITSVVENLPNMIFVKNAKDLKFVRFNKAGEDLLGHSREVLIGKSDYDLFPKEEADFFTEKDREVLETGRLVDIPEEVIETKHQGLRLLHTRKIPIYDDTGTPQYLVGISEDITDRKRADEALRTTRKKLRQGLFASKTGLWDWNTETNELFFSREWKSQLGYAEDELTNTFETWETLLHADDRERTMAYLRNYSKNPVGDYVQEFRLRHKDGSYRWIAEVASFLVEPDGRRVRLLGSHTDITRRKIAEEALQASDAFTRAVLDSLSAHVCVLDKKGIIVKTNDAWKEFTRRHVDDAFTLGDVGDNYLERCRHTIAGDASTSQLILRGVKAVLTGDQANFSAEYRALSQGEAWWFLMRVTPLKESQGVVISHTDISERVRMAGLLEQHILLLGEKREELESLTRKLIEAQEEERKRIARELHDDFNQRLASLAVELETLECTPIARPKPVARRLAAIRVQVGQLSDDLHDLAYRLHPSLLDHVGLEVAARDHIAEFTKRTGLSVKFTAREVPGTLSPEIATNLFRVMQESLQNVFKHAQATEVTVKLAGSPKGIGLSVCDNGKGFDVERKDARMKGLGLVSMQERVRGLGGFLKIHCFARDGTKVCVWIPYF